MNATAAWWTPALAGLIGAIIGGLATLAGGAVQRAAENRDARANKIADIAKQCYDNMNSLRRVTAIALKEQAAYNELSKQAALMVAEARSAGELSDPTPYMTGNPELDKMMEGFTGKPLTRLIANQTKTKISDSIKRMDELEGRLKELEEAATAIEFYADMHFSLEAREAWESLKQGRTLEAEKAFTETMRRIVLSERTALPVKIWRKQKEVAGIRVANMSRRFRKA